MLSSQVINQYVLTRFERFSYSKRREVSRLLYEISKRDQCSWSDILKDVNVEDVPFPILRGKLIRRRYPNLSRTQPVNKFSFPELDIDPESRVTLQPDFEYSPDVFYVEEAVRNSEMVARAQKMFPSASFKMIRQYKDEVRRAPKGIAAYNNRRKHVYLIKEQFDFFKSCPCSNNSVYCGYHVVNLGSGCPLECAYCYLQDYINSPGIVIPANLEDFFQAFKSYKQNIRVGSGELTDSLVYDHITGYSPRIVSFFKDYPDSIFEFKTKTANIDLLLEVEPAGNIVVSWTVNPKRVVDKVEFYTASIENRIKAARKCAQAGYKVVFHFDPVIYYEGWQRDYKNLVNQIFDNVAHKSIGWVSLGTLRMTPKLKRVIENRFPETKILDEEFISSHDTKLRYSGSVRTEIYTKMKEWIEAKSSTVPVYLCMEEKTLCQTTQIMPSKQLLNA